MSDFKNCVECSTNWETKDNRNLSDILCCTLLENGDPSLNSVEPEELCVPAGSKVPSLRLRPFMHPEMTEATANCEIRLFVPPRLHKRIAKITVRSSARNVEVYDRLGEYLLTARGERSEAGHTSRHYTAVFHVHPECFELTLKFVSLSEEANLKLHLLHASFVPFVWSGDLPGLNFERVHDLMTTSPEALPPTARHLLQLLEQQNTARAPTNLLSHLLANQQLTAAAPPDAKRDSSDSTSSGDQTAAGEAPGSLQVTRWLDARLQAMEARIMSRLDDIAARVAKVERAKDEN